jgi:PLP dependent protein
VGANRGPDDISLVAVSKFKSAADIKTCYDSGQRVFGENYFQEMLEKAKELPSDISWHFIGHLQSSKANKLVREVPNLAAVETVDSVKLAEKLNSACELAGRTVPLGVFIQVKTSDEDSKSGVSSTLAYSSSGSDGEENEPASSSTSPNSAGDGGKTELEHLVDFICCSCPNLRLAGLMTIGAPNDVTCFDQLRSVRDALHVRAAGAALACMGVADGTEGRPAAAKLTLKLSMGMSSDFETAIARGADVVRVGSSIFGSR